MDMDEEEETKWVGMGAAFKVSLRDHSRRALKLALPSPDGVGDVFLKEASATTCRSND